MDTTISISKDLRDKLKEFGTKGETYQDIVERLYKNAKKNMLQQFLYDESDSISIAEARKRLKHG